MRVAWRKRERVKDGTRILTMGHQNDIGDAESGVYDVSFNE